MSKNVCYTKINLNNANNSNPTDLNGTNLRLTQTSASNVDNQISYVPIEPDESSLNLSRQAILENGNNPKKINKLGYFRSDRPKNSRKNHFQTIVYNFLERPNGWICFIYHFAV
jgi:hypothetical protein